MGEHRLDTIAMFALDEQVQRCEALLQATPDDAELRLWLAWSLRQRDSTRALTLARALREAWPEDAPAQARRLLVEAECLLLEGRLDESETLLSEALRRFEARADAWGCADAHWLAYYLAADRGDGPALQASLLQAIAQARASGDALRLLMMEASLARAEVMRDAAAAERDWGQRLPAASPEPACGAALADFRGLLAAMQADYLPAIEAFSTAFGLAMRCGQLRRAIALATNLGFTYTRMSDFESAMDWLKRALDLARGARWPGMIGLCLAHTGEALRRLGQLDNARELLRECLQLSAGQPQARTAALACRFLAQTEMDSGDFAAGLEAFEQLARGAATAGSLDLQLDAQQGRARALLGLGRAEAARAAAEQALAMAEAQQERSTALELRALLGDIARTQGRVDAALALYEQALAAAEALAGYATPPELLDGASQAFAAAGRFEAAFGCAHRASQARLRRYGEEAGQRSRAMHAHHQIERARAESEHLRRLAASEAARFADLQSAHQVLQHLGEIGQEITAELQTERVIEVLERRVHALLDAPSLAVYLLDEAGEQLQCAYGREDGERFADAPIPLADPQSFCALCVREGRELLLDGAAAAPAQIEGTSQMQSLLFVPLRVAERITGVITVQSPRRQAYGEREQLVLRSLSAYAAIALDNARAYLRLSELQRQVMAQEKLAALGALVAGVAHELNTPIGNSLLTASTLLEHTQTLAQRLQQGQLRRSELESYTRSSQEGLQVIERSMQGAAQLVDNFKQVAQDRDTQQRRRFALALLCEQALHALAPQIERAGHRLLLQIDAGLQLDSYPGPLGQALEVLVGNALLHGLQPEQPGEIRLRAEALSGGRCRIEVADNGRGMSEAVLLRIFEPFFSTRFGQGGSGLGLSICHHIVHGLLGGRLSVVSAPGRGSRFIIELPLVAPS